MSCDVDVAEGTGQAGVGTVISSFTREAGTTGV